MTTDEVREKYLRFFKSSPRNHREISVAPLVVEGDSTTLFTSAGMQPLIPYLMGEPHPEGKRLVNSQPSIRTQDIEEVGDNRHTTFFEMLGNWSLGDYWKAEQLPWIWEFLTNELGLPKEKLWVSVFEGNELAPKDQESIEIYKKLGVPESKITEYGDTKNWWSRSGPPSKMPEGEIGGPSSEIFYEFGQVEHDLKYGHTCHPNCDCGRFLEIGNSVFVEYKKVKNGIELLPKKNIDFGGGLERITAVINDSPDIFQIDVYQLLVEKIEQISGKGYQGNEREMRIIADHFRASDALIKEGVIPANKLHGYVLRRLIRRAAVKMRSLKGSFERTDLSLVKDNEVIEEEVVRFGRSLDRGLREVEKIKRIDGKKAFDLYQTYGFPLELTIELFAERGQRVARDQFEIEFNKHKDLSRTASAGIFKGGLADHSAEVVRLHTATHLLHAALRKVLGGNVSQKGSNITAERLRFDFTHDKRLSDKEIGLIEGLVNEQIAKDLPVTVKTMTLAEAKESGALAFFGDRYDEKVKVYSIGPSTSSGFPFSREICGGPHVSRLSEIGGRVRIVRQESVSAGVRRIYAKITAHG